MALFDKSAFDSLIDGDKALFKELLHLYATDYPQIVTELRTAITNQDLKQVEILSHRLRGMVRNFFAADLAAKAEVIEDRAREGDLHLAMPRVEELAAQLKQLEDELRSHFGSPDAPTHSSRR